MKISHKLNSLSTNKPIDNAGFLLSNYNGNYLSLGISSRYSGLFCNLNNNMFKIIDDISQEGEIIEVTNNLNTVERTRKIGGNKIKEIFHMPYGRNSLIYRSKASAQLLLDIRHPYDSRKWGKNYEVSKEGNFYIIKYSKYTDTREDNSNGEHEYDIYIAVTGINMLASQPDSWTKKEYSFDRERNSYPYETYVYSALRFSSDTAVISVADNKEHALNECKYIMNNLNRYENEHTQTEKNKKIPDKKINIAYNCAINSLKILFVKNKGIYAGLPWFFQFWSRDENISIKALMLTGNLNKCKTILLSRIKEIQDDGRLPRQYGEKQTCADSIGWYVKRLGDFFEIAGKDLHKYITTKEYHDIIKALEKSCINIQKHYSKNNYITNYNQDTWMDSLARAGVRIEIQALQLNLYSLLYKLTKDQKYSNLEKQLKEKIRTYFRKDNILADGLGDFTIRPNIFIAYYIYPDLLTRNEWTACFDTILPRLWCDWGGISTIDNTDERYCSDHTGETPKSYHNGDSWYWINNLAALVLAKTDKNKYKEYIYTILNASADEILFMNYAGHHTELSSSSSLQSQGCLCQAWSNAMFIELVDCICLS